MAPTDSPRGWLESLLPSRSPEPRTSPSSPTDDPGVLSAVQHRLQPLTDSLVSSVLDHPYLVVSTATISSSLTLAAVVLYARYLKRIPNAEYVTPAMLAQKRWIKGRVTSVGDADNFRLFHTPILTWGSWRTIPSTTQDLKDRTIHIRIAGVDAPEAAHFGRPAQPYSADALEWLKREVEGKVIHCQLLRRDQYGRIVAMTVLPRRFLPLRRWGKYMSLEMLRAGYAITYTQAGAEYGKWGLEEFQRAEDEAKTLRRGMWIKGDVLESPTDYKKRFAKGVDEAEKAESKQDSAQSRTWRSWLPSWLFGAKPARK